MAAVEAEEDVDRTSGVLRPQILVGGEAMLLQLMKLWWIDFQARNGLLV